MKKKPMTGAAQVRRAFSELASGKFVANAQQRNRNAKGPWDIVVAMIAIPTWLYLWWLGSELAWKLHVLFHPEHAGLQSQFWPKDITLWPSVSSAMMDIAPAFPAIGLALMIGNFVTNLMPPARRDFERKALANPNVGYKSAQAGLFAFTLILLAVSYILVVIGAATLNHLK